MDIRRLLAALCVGLLAAMAASPVQAQDRSAEASSAARVRESTTPGPEWIPVPAAQLARMRGGFVTASGLSLSFAVQRSVHVDGVLVSYVNVDVPDVARMTPAQAEELARLSRAQVLQLGAGNTVQPGVGAGPATGLVVQNALEGRHIQVQTTVETAVNTLGLLQAINASDALNSALTAGRGGP